MKQSQIFLREEGKAWLKRNEAKLTGEDDPVIKAIGEYKIKPKRVLEVGCANGWRLKILHERYNCWIRGVDPGCAAPDKTITKNTASYLPLINSCVDTIIYGWCLYLCDPEDYFRIAMEGDRVLQDGGYLIVYDFISDYPFKTPYKHKKGLYSHHYDFPKLWLGNPAYSIYGKTVQYTGFNQDETCVTILKKNLKNAFPVEK